MEFWSNIILSTITVVIAVYALFQTKKQIEISNKQHLFDQRVENFLIVKGLIVLYRGHAESFKYFLTSRPFHTIGSFFVWFTNNTYLEGISNAISNPLGPLHKDFLKQMENLNEVSYKAKLLFPAKLSEDLCYFVLSYKEFLQSMYKYKISYNNMEEERDKLQSLGKILTEDDACNMIGEQLHTDLIDCFNNLANAESRLLAKDLENRINKQINLF